MPELLSFEEADVQEEFFERGWTDGLPIVPPTQERVAKLLAAAGLEPEEVIGGIAQRGRTVTAEEVATNAVMAGCRADYGPLVMAAVGAMLAPEFNAHAVLTSTGGAALCTVVSGPLAGAVGMNARHNALGAGNRANATIGRTLRLVAMNVFEARTGGMDGSSLGHPGKYTLCFAEDDPPQPWEPLRVALGYDAADTTVSLLATEGPRQVANHLSPDGAEVLKTFAAAIRSPATFAVGKGGQGLCVIGPEHMAAIIAAGLGRRDAAEMLVRESRIAPDQLEAAGVVIERGAQHDMTPGADGLLPAIPTPDDLMLVSAGGAGAGWSAYLPAWAPTLHSRGVTRRVRPAGEALPDCGPDSCAVDLPGSA